MLKTAAGRELVELERATPAVGEKQEVLRMAPGDAGGLAAPPARLDRLANRREEEGESGEGGRYEV
jgi:hypothetical protein